MMRAAHSSAHRGPTNTDTRGKVDDASPGGFRRGVLGRDGFRVATRTLPLDTVISKSAIVLALRLFLCLEKS
jgi:hypothetical protein